MERRHKEAGDELHQQTERHLGGEKGIHQPAARMRVLSNFEGGGRMDGGTAQSRREPEEHRREECECYPEDKFAPSRVEDNAHRIFRHAQHGDDQWSRPHPEQRSQRRRQGCQLRTLHQNQLDQPPSARADRDT